jgi:hypothetical protein
MVCFIGRGVSVFSQFPLACISPESALLDLRALAPLSFVLAILERSPKSNSMMENRYLLLVHVGCAWLLDLILLGPFVPAYACKLVSSLAATVRIDSKSGELANVLVSTRLQAFGATTWYLSGCV